MEWCKVEDFKAKPFMQLLLREKVTPAESNMAFGFPYGESAEFSYCVGYTYENDQKELCFAGATDEQLCFDADGMHMWDEMKKVYDEVTEL